MSGTPSPRRVRIRAAAHYWLDAGTGKVFCLVEAPDAETAAAVHRDSHGLVADEIYEVTEG